jgi:hypothetical protein
LVADGLFALVERRAASMTLGITTIADSISVATRATINPAYFFIFVSSQVRCECSLTVGASY